MKSPIKYFGGKGTMFNTIAKEFPDHSSYRIYVEPFGGSGAMLFSQPLGHVEVYNDLYSNVYSLFKTLSTPELYRQFKDMCDLAIYHEQISIDCREKLKNNNLSIIDRAFCYWYTNRTRHNGIGGFSSNCYIRRNMSKATSDFLSCIDRLKDIHDRLSSVIILNRDALEVIKKYDASNTFYYLDPPYSWETRTSSRYAVDFSPEQQKNLVDILLSTKSKILLSGYINEEYKRLEKAGWSRKDFEVKTTTGNFEKKIKIESLYKNY